MGRILTTLAVAAGVLAFAATPARADAPTPPQNLAPGQVADACKRAPTGAECENSIIYGLDAARAAMGLAPYALPPGFTALAPEQQLLILVNLDRVAYGVDPVLGLNAALDADALTGAHAHADPQPSVPFDGFASNWAGGYPNVLQAYFGWVYADGYPGQNLDCVAPADAGCWGHRRDTFFDGQGLPLLMGAAYAADTRDYAFFIAAPSRSLPADVYTWAGAQAAGAGTYPYDPGKPLTIDTAGAGTAGAGTAAGCAGTCVSWRATGSALTLTARPNRRAVLAGWSGPCTGTAPTCVVTMNGPQQVRARFADASVSATVRRRGSAVEVSGRIAPRLKGQAVAVEVAHRFSATARTGADGTYRVRRRLARGRYAVRVRFGPATRTVHVR
jgi:hypothetical protein